LNKKKSKKEWRKELELDRLGVAAEGKKKIGKFFC